MTSGGTRWCAIVTPSGWASASRQHKMLLRRCRGAPTGWSPQQFGVQSRVWGGNRLRDSIPHVQGLNVYFTGSRERDWVADPRRIRRGKLFVAGQWHPRPVPDGMPKNLVRPAAAAAGPAAVAVDVKREPVKPQTTARTAPSAAIRDVKASVASSKATAASAAGALSPSASRLRSPQEGAAAAVMVRRSARERQSRVTLVGAGRNRAGQAASWVQHVVVVSVRARVWACVWGGGGRGGSGCGGLGGWWRGVGWGAR